MDPCKIILLLLLCHVSSVHTRTLHLKKDANSKSVEKWIVNIQIGNKVLCTGVHVSNSWILTFADCIDKKINLKDYRVVNKEGTKRKVIKEEKSSNGETLILLKIKVNGDTQISKFAQLSDSLSIPSKYDFQLYNMDKKNIVIAGDVDFVSDKICKKKGVNGIKGKGNKCFQVNMDKRTKCMQGSPIFGSKKNEIILQGLSVTSSDSCSSAPQSMTPIQPHLAWINTVASGIVSRYNYNPDYYNKDQQECDDITIIGAGVTGSYAAWRLRNRNLQISMYEYSNRIGGRCFTVQLPGIPDVNIEMGAMRFKPSSHPLANKTIHSLGLEVIDFELGIGPSQDSLYYLRGKHMRYRDIPEQVPYNLQPEYRVDHNTLKWNVFKNFTEVNGDTYKSLDGADLSDQSRDMYLAKYLDAETVHYLKDTEIFVQGQGPDVSALYSLASDPNQPSPGPAAVKTVKTGFQSIPSTLVKQFLQANNKHSFNYNRHLRSVRKRDDGKYTLTFQPTQTVNGITTDKNGDEITRCAEKVILAIPRIALENIDWERLYEKKIQEYLKDSVKEIKAAKIYFGYDNAWWRQLPNATQYAISMTPIRQSYDFGVSKTTSKGVLNIAYTDGDTRLWREAMKTGNSVLGVQDDSIAATDLSVSMARKYYAEVFDIPMSSVPEPNSSVMTVWDQYPIGASWYAWRPGFNWKEVEKRMIKPSTNDHVYIASNIFSSSNISGWIEGGLEIVEKVLKYFEK